MSVTTHHVDGRDDTLLSIIAVVAAAIAQTNPSAGASIREGLASIEDLALSSANNEALAMMAHLWGKLGERAPSMTLE